MSGWAAFFALLALCLGYFIGVGMTGDHFEKQARHGILTIRGVVYRVTKTD